MVITRSLSSVAEVSLSVSTEATVCLEGLRGRRLPSYWRLSPRANGGEGPRRTTPSLPGAQRGSHTVPTPCLGADETL